MNVITGDEGHPEGVLFRAGEKYNGPAKLTKQCVSESNKKEEIEK